MLYTPMPWEIVFPEEVQSEDQLFFTIEGRLCQIRRGADGWPRIERLISTDPQDYLQPTWSPRQPLITW